MKVLLIRDRHDKTIESSVIVNDDQVVEAIEKISLELPEDLTVISISPDTLESVIEYLKSQRDV